MSTPTPQSRESNPALVADEAAAWLARRDRGLTPAEQDAYVQWLSEDRCRAEAVTQHAAAFERMMTLYEWQPGQSAEPNPDLFAPRRRWRRSVAATSLAAAAALAICSSLWWRSIGGLEPATAQKSYLRVNERHALPDGSMVELKDGSRIALEFSAGERRVRLVGEGNFDVAKDPARPFVVEAGGVTVRAVGTAFNVRFDPDAVDVLVTEGVVCVQPPVATATARSVVASEADISGSLVSAWQRVVVSLASGAPPQVIDVGGSEIADALAWRAPRLQFFETPLEVAIAEFNERNRTQLVLGDGDLNRVPIGGTFRVDNVEGFVRLLEVTLDLRANPRGNDIVLTRAR